MSDPLIPIEDKAGKLKTVCVIFKYCLSGMNKILPKYEKTQDLIQNNKSTSLTGQKFISVPDSKLLKAPLFFILRRRFHLYIE